jgi:flagellar assembly factor FliW
VDDPNLAFVVTDPTFFEQDYSVPIRPEQMESLGIEKLEDAQVFVIVNKIGDQLTGQSSGPAHHQHTRQGRASRSCFGDKRWTTRHPLMRVAESGEKTATA